MAALPAFTSVLSTPPPLPRRGINFAMRIPDCLQVRTHRPRRRRDLFGVRPEIHFADKATHVVKELDYLIGFSRLEIGAVLVARGAFVCEIGQNERCG